MNSNGLFVLVEGSDDARFIERVISRLLSDKYDWICTYEYSHKTPKDVCALIHSINRMKADYIFLRDLDFAPCFNAQKQKIRERYVSVKDDKIFIVRIEIEGWYLAGLNDSNVTELGLEPYSTTDSITKEEFIKRIPRRFTSRIDFMQEILKRYSVDVAKIRNTSFRYFLGKNL